MSLQRSTLFRWINLEKDNLRCLFTLETRYMECFVKKIALMYQILKKTPQFSPKYLEYSVKIKLQKHFLLQFSVFVYQNVQENFIKFS